MGGVGDGGDGGDGLLVGLFQGADRQRGVEPGAGLAAQLRAGPPSARAPTHGRPRRRPRRAAVRTGDDGVASNDTRSFPLPIRPWTPPSRCTWPRRITVPTRAGGTGRPRGTGRIQPSGTANPWGCQHGFIIRVCLPKQASPGLSFPPTPPGSKPSWVNSAWTPRPTSTRPPCNCWASSLGRTRSSPATPPSANATWRRKSSRPAATTCSPSRRTSRAWRWTSQRGLPSRPRRNRSPRLFPPALPTSLPGKTATTVDKGHGRLERRTLRVTSILTLHQKWPGLKQGLR